MTSPLSRIIRRLEQREQHHLDLARTSLTASSRAQHRAYAAAFQSAITIVKFEQEFGE